MKQDKAAILFTTDSIHYCYPQSNSQLFMFSKSNANIIFEVMPKDFTISTLNSSCRFNTEMLKETSPIISEYVKNHPNERQYTLRITDEKNVLSKFEQLYQGKNVFFEEDELSISRQIIEILQIKNCPSYLKQGVLNNGHNPWMILLLDTLESGVIIDHTCFINFLRKNCWETFNIITKRRNYKCNIFGIYTSDVIRQFLTKNSIKNEYFYDFEDENEEFQLICDFFNFKMVDINNSNMDSLKFICEDLQINCIIPQIDEFINNYEKMNQKIDEQQPNIDSIDNLIGILYKIKNIGIEKAKFMIIQSKWFKKEEKIQELAAFILQIIKPSFSLQNEMAELLIELSKEEDKTDKFNLLITTIVDYLMNIYMPHFKQLNIEKNEFKIEIHYKEKKNHCKYVNEVISLNNKCVYSFIRILYRRGLIPKEKIIDHLTDYNCQNPYLNAFFLPELIKIDPSNSIKLDINDDYNYELLHKHVLSLYNKYFPNKINLYEQMLDNLEPDDELTKSIRNDDIENLKKIIIRNGLNINKSRVPYNIFDDFDENVSLINYAALYGSLKCFKFLLLNEGEIDDATFYFAISGFNIEIIRIVEQKCPFNNEKQETNYEYLARYNYLYNNNVKKKYLNFNDINNIIAPTIVMHKNDLFDWLFENNFVCKSENNESLESIAILSAMSGNSHSLIEIMDKGLNLSSNLLQKMIFYSAKNGFYSLTKLLINLFDDKTDKKLIQSNEIDKYYDETNNYNDKSDFNYTLIVQFGSASIFSLLFMKIEQSLLEKTILYAIFMDYRKIVYYFMENLNKLEFTIINESFIELVFTISFEWKRNELYNFLYEKIQKTNPELYTFELYQKLLNTAYRNSYLLPIITITEKILEFEPKYDFTDYFIESSTTDLMKFFIDKKVVINYSTISLNTTKLASIDFDIFKLLYDKADISCKYNFYNCIYEAINNKNMKIIDFLLKENKPNGFELFKAIDTKDIKIVDIVLKYNSEPSFINLIFNKKTAINYAVSLNNLDIVKRLLSIKGIDPSIYDQQGKNALTQAISLGSVEFSDIIDEILKFYDNEVHVNQWFIDDVYNKIGTKANYDSSNWPIFKKILKSKLKPNKTYFSDCESGAICSFLVLACLNNDFEVVEVLLKIENSDVNLYDIRTGNTPLMIAINKKNIKIAELLIKNPKTNINWINQNNVSAITIAVKNNLIKIVDLLLKDERFNPIESRICASFILSTGEISKKLSSLDYLDVNQYIILNYSEKINALIDSVEKNDIEKVDLIINHPSFNKYKSDINKAIILATEKNNVNIFKILIQLIDNDIYITNKEGQNILLIAANNFSLDIMNEIFKHPGFDSKKYQLLNMFTQIFIKILENKKISSFIKVLNIILEYDEKHEHLIKMNELLPNGKTFFTIIESDFNEISKLVNFLIEKGCDPNKPDKNNIYPLEKSIEISSIDYFTILLNSGLIRYNECEKGYLNIAASYLNVEYLKLLLEKIDINSTNSNGETALFEACKYGNISAINILFQHNDLDYLHCDKNGNDALKTLMQLIPENKQYKSKNVELKRRKNYHNRLISIIEANRGSFNRKIENEWNNADDNWE